MPPPGSPYGFAPEMGTQRLVPPPDEVECWEEWIDYEIVYERLPVMPFSRWDY